MSRKFIAIALLAFAMLAMMFAIFRRPGGAEETSLTVYCPAGLKKPVEAIAQQYEKELNVQVNLQYGGTGTLLSQIEVAKQGDIFIAADDGSMGDARKRDLVAEVIPLVMQHPVLAVPVGNPKGLQTLDDLMKPEIKVALAVPDAASISRVTRKLLGPAWDPLAAKAAVMKPTVTEIAADTQLGVVDGAIIWDATVAQFKELEAVEIAELTKHRENASAGILKACSQPQAALKFARYLAAPDRGGKIFQEHGFELAGGDKWAAKPEMILYSGGVNRLAIEELIQQFADREGVSVTTVFNGCGILCTAMKAMEDSVNPKFPDAYFACDVCFVPPVADHFPEAVLLTETEIVMAVHKGNPKKIQTLADLAQPGLRVGLCNAEQSTLGFMTNAMLRQSGLLESVHENVRVQVPTADFLINQLRAGSLDAVIVYKVNVAIHDDVFDFVKLPEDKARAVQPFAVRQDSTNRRLSERLLAFLRQHRDAFEAAGFVWRGESTAVPSDELEIPDWLKQK